MLGESGIATLLITDEPQLIELELAVGFDRCIAVRYEGEPADAGDIESTQLERFFATAADYIAEMREPGLVWLHSRGMAANWDAPFEMRQSYADEEDPTPPDFVEVPRLDFEVDHDPDERMGIVHAYAAQVTLWDMCLGVLMESLKSNAMANSALFTLMSPRGFPLGEHGIVGSGLADAPRDALYGELVNLPWLIRDPSAGCTALRSAALVQPCDWYATLLDWFEISLPAARLINLMGIMKGDCDGAREFVVMHNDSGHSAIRTPAWFMCGGGVGGQQSEQLFAKPDDFWEVNDVADRCPEVVEKLRHVYDAVMQGNKDEPLDEMLLKGNN